MAYKVFVDGQSGTTGLRLLDYLKQHPDVDILYIDEDKRRDVKERARLLNAADVAFLCLPDEASKEAVGLIDNDTTCVIDASTAFRTDDGWVYGLPELTREQRSHIRNRKRIANPGCHASAFILLVRPLVDAGLLPADFPISAYSLTGYSGGGKNMIADYQKEEHGQRASKLDSPRPYALGLKHKHLPEMRLHGHLAAEPIFTPIVGANLQGLSVQIPLPLLQLNLTPEAIIKAYHKHYDNEPFIRVATSQESSNSVDGGYLDIQHNNGSNKVDILVCGNEEQALLVARLDNLGKGAAGAAIQSMNIHLGLDESTAL